MTEPAVCASHACFSPPHFTGKERDTESGNDYFGARYYASSMGRFMSPDWSARVDPVPYARLDDPQSLNLYVYMVNNPLGGVDSDGHCPSWAQGICNAAQGAFGTAAQLWNDGVQRAKYAAASAGLSGPDASVARKAFQSSTYNNLSPIGQSITDAAKQSRAGQLDGKTAEQLAASASKTNAGMNAIGDASKVLGAVGVVAAVGTVAYNTANAPDGQKAQAAVDGTLTLGASWAGAEAGAAVGSVGGPWGAFAGSLIGGFGGGALMSNLLSSGSGGSFTSTVSDQSTPMGDGFYMEGSNDPGDYGVTH